MHGPRHAAVLKEVSGTLPWSLRGYTVNCLGHLLFQTRISNKGERGAVYFGYNMAKHPPEAEQIHTSNGADITGPEIPPYRDRYLVTVISAATQSTGRDVAGKCTSLSLRSSNISAMQAGLLSPTLT